MLKLLRSDGDEKVGASASVESIDLMPSAKAVYGAVYDLADHYLYPICPKDLEWFGVVFNRIVPHENEYRAVVLETLWHVEVAKSDVVHLNFRDTIGRLRAEGGSSSSNSTSSSSSSSTSSSSSSSASNSSSSSTSSASSSSSELPEAQMSLVKYGDRLQKTDSNTQIREIRHKALGEITANLELMLTPGGDRNESLARGILESAYSLMKGLKDPIEPDDCE
ncbi:hypothetical protein FACS189449_10010 [Alphaproteobacteria bacterium]|nr:hypothetical protein FACS189449_10010 [Alphaproteobacteria bacterium]